MRPHKLNQFTEYMQKAVDHFGTQPAGRHILDLPAGNGQLTDALREIGHRVTSADINYCRDDYIYADMTKPLCFDDGTFDAAVCLEGIEHVLNPYSLLGELIRVTRLGGQIMVSTPNIMNMYSRLQFLLTGTFFQFHPAQLPEVGPDELADRFHISPMSYHALRYLGTSFGARVIKVDADRFKRPLLLPLFGACLLLGRPWMRRLYFSRKYAAHRDRNEEIVRHVNSWPVLFGRSLILVFEKTTRIACATDDSRSEIFSGRSTDRPSEAAA